MAREDGTEVVNEEGGYSEIDVDKIEIPDSDLGPTDQSDDIPDDLDAGASYDPEDNDGVDGDEDYKPNFSYKVYDEVREIPEEFRGLITDKESEDRIRSIMARADGLEGMKAKNEKVRSERDNYREKLDEYSNKFREIDEDRQQAEYYRQKDVGLFLRHHGITDDQVFDYANRAYDAREEPEARTALEQRQEAIRRSYNDNRQNQTIVQTAMESSNRVHQEALDMAMRNPETAEIASLWDARVEVPGDFLNKVQDYGNSVYQKTGKSITPFEAVKYVTDTYSKVLTPDSGSTGNGSGRPAARRRETIPTVGTGGGGRSPTKKRPRDIDEFDAMVEKGSY